MKPPLFRLSYRAVRGLPKEPRRLSEKVSRLPYGVTHSTGGDYRLRDRNVGDRGNHNGPLMPAVPPIAVTTVGTRVTIAAAAIHDPVIHLVALLMSCLGSYFEPTGTGGVIGAGGGEDGVLAPTRVPSSRIVPWGLAPAVER